ncbi:(Fe-S)-binding protein [Egibacter rhizosphaerae]|uniref:Glycolate oxidase iron-sulfur subunit n=1 Tax=Egibacter rhizosphaerae TaxID=1670831 RepID=A0A411YBF0_9ACTN|nr:(Fe-S)-binding protein [Egibacter rhizosphaerae]QBI18530.1 (Fe-S)-binding protein [Egibacter rhizosphaerae]
MTFDADKLAQCVGCGMCLSACPTYAVTGLEQHNPRGRLVGMRLVHDGELSTLDPDYVDSMEGCVQCRACEPACPSLVEFGALMETARTDIEAARAHAPSRGGGRLRSSLVRWGLGLLRRPVLLRLGTILLSLAQLTRADRLLPRRLRLARRVRLRELAGRLPARQRADAWLFRGCVMDVWFRGAHGATLRLLERSGYRVDAARRGACCGALDLHQGFEDRAARSAAEVIAAHRGTSGPVVVDSAGCGAAMKEYGRLLGTEEARVFADRVRDMSELVDPNTLPAGVLREPVAYQHACHLRNVQHVESAPVALLDRVLGPGQLRRTADGERCCGAGGAYNALRPDLAEPIGARKRDAVTATGATRVTSGNPGCLLQLAQHGLPVVHIAEVLWEAVETAER